jgi:signal peptidase II
MSLARRKDLIMVALGLLVVCIDQLTKRWIVDYFTAAPRPPVPVLGSILELQYVQNTGVAFSMLEGQTLKFVFIAFAIVVIAVLYWRMRDTASMLLKVSFGLVLGGAAGNLIDRFTHRYVVDFIHFQIPGVFNFAVFNIADSAIVIGVLMLAFLLWRESTARQGAHSDVQRRETPPLSVEPEPPAHNANLAAPAHHRTTSGI